MSLVSKMCYLCGDALIGNLNDDHSIPQQFIKGQPKKRGFDYGGVIKVHEDCNNAFGGRSGNSETYCIKALKILNLIYNEDKIIVRERKDNPDIKIMTIVDKDLKGFTSFDLEYFGFINATHLPYNQLSKAEFYKDKVKINPLQKPLNVSLTVLAKSAAALLFKRYCFYPNESWRIYALTFWGDKNIDYDTILGNTKPFDIGVKVWLKEYDNGDWFCSYKLYEFQVYFIFLCTSFLINVYKLKEILPNSPIYYFESQKLKNLLGYDWTKYVL